MSFAYSASSKTGLTLGVGLIYAGMPEYEPIAIVASLIAIFNMALFAFLFFRNS